MGKFDKLLKPRTKRFRHDATFMRRTGAFLLDLLLIDIVLTGPFQHLFSRVLEVEFPATLTEAEFGAMMVLFLIAYTYFVLFEYVLGQTPGMMLLSLKLKALPDIWQALVRNAFLIPVFPLVLLWIIEPLTLIFTKRSVLERITNTRLLYERSIVI